MSVLINADTSDGLKFTSDTSGEIKLQSAGTDIATVSSTGITMASGKGLAATGHVLQVVNGTTSTTVSSSVTSYTDTGLTATITPSSSSSKILVIATHPQCSKSNGNAGSSLKLKLLRDSTDIVHTDALLYTGTAIYMYGTVALSCLDAPATTSAITYKTQFANGATAASVSVQNSSTLSSITLMEIAG